MTRHFVADRALAAILLPDDHRSTRRRGRVLIPMGEGRRSINVALSAAMIAGEALRQTGGFAG